MNKAKKIYITSNGGSHIDARHSDRQLERPSKQARISPIIQMVAQSKNELLSVAQGALVEALCAMGLPIDNVEHPALRTFLELVDKLPKGEHLGTALLCQLILTLRFLGTYWETKG